jgi:NAD+-dependent secondary alcohol dehydrogenase Adh1
VLRVPDGLDLVKAAPLSDAGLTAYRAVQAVGPMLRPGKTCVVLGVGGLGRLAIQLVRALYPVPVIAIDKAEQARAAAAVCGATHVFDVTDRTVTDVHDATRGGAAAVLDFVGEKGAENLAWRLLAPGGAHQVVGYGGVVKIPTGILVGGEYRLAGTQVGTFVELAELLEVCQAGLIDVPVQRFALADVNAAIEALAAGTVDGRAVLQP